MSDIRIMRPAGSARAFQSSAPAVFAMDYDEFKGLSLTASSDCNCRKTAGGSEFWFPTPAVVTMSHDPLKKTSCETEFYGIQRASGYSQAVVNCDLVFGAYSVSGGFAWGWSGWFWAYNSSLAHADVILYIFRACASADDCNPAGSYTIKSTYKDDPYNWLVTGTYVTIS